MSFTEWFIPFKQERRASARVKDAKKYVIFSNFRKFVAFLRKQFLQALK